MGLFSPELPQHDTSACVSAGFRGKNCEENIDDCPGNLCLNGATCVDDVNRYSCVCPPTYTGELCEQDVDECAHRPSVCQNGATCTNSIGGYSCICVNGWTGPDCSVNIDDCAGAACFNGATCIDRVGSFYCRCTPGKTGSNKCVGECSKIVTEFYPAPDPQAGTVGHFPRPSFQVQPTPLQTPFTGHNEELNRACFTHSYAYKRYEYVSLLCHLDDACTSNPCHADAICDTSPINGSYTCSCASGYKGVDCSEDIDECEQGTSFRILLHTLSIDERRNDSNEEEKKPLSAVVLEDEEKFKRWRFD
uniref:EGF-like domain-containing protein n=1 Tax=Timema monikensis TaxID=170555 RepID=A0A7R9E2J9_9NEOP|nr:unnamed protein product [Timema monikensis]